MREENGGKQMKTVWRMPPPGRDEKRFGKHPTQKPLALIRRCLRASTHPGEIVFDPFVGSGSTGVAALGLGRRFWGVEAMEEYAELSRVRLSDVDLKPANLSPAQLSNAYLKPVESVARFLKKYPELAPSDDISGNGADSDVLPTQVKMLESRKQYAKKTREDGAE